MSNNIDRQTKMETEKVIHEYIARKKKMECSPLLEEKIMHRLYAEQQESGEQLFVVSSLLQKTMIAASISIVVLFGIALGNSYKDSMQNQSKLFINDNQIENLILITGGEDE